MSDVSLRAGGGGRWFAWDPLWNTYPEFEMDHFRLLFSKILGMVTAPGQANRHHRPRENKCCVYASAVMWIILYSAPIRAQIVANDRHIYRSCGPASAAALFEDNQGISHRLTSSEAAAILARMLPFRFMSDELRRTYLWKCEALRKDSFILPRNRALAWEERCCSIAHWR